MIGKFSGLRLWRDIMGKGERSATGCYDGWQAIKEAFVDNERGWCCLFFHPERDSYQVRFDGAVYQTPSQIIALGVFDGWCVHFPRIRRIDDND